MMLRVCVSVYVYVCVCVYACACVCVRACVCVCESGVTQYGCMILTQSIDKDQPSLLIFGINVHSPIF